MSCPDCGATGAAFEKHEWSDGAVTKRCLKCGFTDWVPPAPEVRGR